MMPLTSAQKTTLAADIAANTSVVNGSQIKDIIHDQASAFAVAAWYNGFPGTDYYVWNPLTKVSDILDQITYANYDPTDAPDTTQLYENQAMTTQIKQANLQLMLQGRTTFDASRKNLRAGLNDATTNLFTGVAGASRSGGWTGIVDVLKRKATFIEKLLAVDDGAGVGNNVVDARGLITNPDNLGFTGPLTQQDMQDLWGV